MRIAFTDPLTRKQASEGSSFNVTASFFDDQGTPIKPATVQHAITGQNREAIKARAGTTAATSAVIPISNSNNAVINDKATAERKVLTVLCDEGLPTEARAQMSWAVLNAVVVP